MATNSCSPESLGANLRVFVRAYARMQRHSVRDCAAGGSSYVRCLILTELRGGPLSQSELSDKLEIEKGAMSRAVRILLNGGQVARRLHNSDGRISMVSLTAKGTREASKLDRELESLNHSLVSRLTEAERKMAAEVLQTLCKALMAFGNKETKSSC